MGSALLVDYSSKTSLGWVHLCASLCCWVLLFQLLVFWFLCFKLLKRVLDKTNKLLWSLETRPKRTPLYLTLSQLPVKTQCLSQCYAFQRLVISIEFWSTESIFNQFSVFSKTKFNALCVCLQYEQPRSIKIDIRSGKPITLVFSVVTKMRLWHWA
jgi:hypothetical protein